MDHIFDQSHNHVFDQCINALEELGITVNTSDKNNYMIEASTGASIFSWGEKITIRVEKISIQKAKVIVESTASAQVISWGKNSENETKILANLKNRIG